MSPGLVSWIGCDVKKIELIQLLGSRMKFFIVCRLMRKKNNK
uniref:Uncharacterized protein n=1 Tax=Rhizophora mucronata TaxID=61149 RepID=A0A2P2QVK7_RHIMU